MKFSTTVLFQALVSLALVTSLKVDIHYRGTLKTTFTTIENEGECFNLDNINDSIDRFNILSLDTKVEFYEGEDCVLKQVASGTSPSNNLKTPIIAKSVNLIKISNSETTKKSNTNHAKIVRRGAFTSLLKSLFLPKRSNIEETKDSNKLDGKEAFAKVEAFVNSNSKTISKFKSKSKINLDKEESDA